MTAPAPAARARLLPVRDHPAFVFLASALLAAAVVVPWLGSAGLWDPWETHYAEVGRQMLVRADLVHPFWQDGWFFSKPVLTPWLAALGLFVSGETSTSGPLPPLTEWAVRLPFALLSILAVGLLAHHVSRLTSRRAGLLSAVVLASSPLWFFVSRQAMTDLPFVACASISTSCFLRVRLDAGASRRWLEVAWAAAALATLGKGLLGVGLPLVTLGLSMLVEARRPRELWQSMRAVTPWTGLALFAVIALPWYVAMLRFPGLDSEGKTFFQRFFLHDHFARLTSGVHSTTPNGTFAYFLEQGAYGFFPWVGLVPFAVSRVVGSPAASGRARLELALVGWVLFSFALFTLSATRFHHYCLPMIPPLAVLVALGLEELLEGGPVRAPAMLVCGAVLTLLVGKDLATSPRKWIELFTYNHERPYPDFIDAWPVFPGAPGWLDAHGLGWLLTACAATALLLLARDFGWALVTRRRLIGALLFTALLGASWLSWSHWVQLSRHWTQRDLFGRYYQERRPDEPIAAFYMDWKGETFYSRNEVLQLGPANWQQALPGFLGRPGRKWMLVEHARLQWLTQLVGPTHTLRSIDPSLNDKFVLLLVDA